MRVFSNNSIRLDLLDFQSLVNTGMLLVFALMPRFSSCEKSRLQIPVRNFTKISVFFGMNLRLTENKITKYRFPTNLHRLLRGHRFNFLAENEKLRLQESLGFPRIEKDRHLYRSAWVKDFIHVFQKSPVYIKINVIRTILEEQFE
jgi:hypothetical protein